MLKKDRNKLNTGLDAIDKTEKLCNDLIKIVNDDTKVPKRKKYLGEMTLNHAIKSYENSRLANNIIPNNDHDIKARISFSTRAAYESFHTLTDLRLWNHNMNCDKKTKWYYEIMMKGVECNELLTRWNQSNINMLDKDRKDVEEKRNKIIKKHEREKQIKKELEEINADQQYSDKH